MISCLYQALGCKIRIVGSDPKKHDEKYAAIHLSFVNLKVTALEKQIDSLRTENEQLKGEMESQKESTTSQSQKIQTLEKTLSTLSQAFEEFKTQVPEAVEQKSQNISHDGAPPSVNVKFTWDNYNNSYHKISFSCFFALVFSRTFTRFCFFRNTYT